MEALRAVAGDGTRLHVEVTGEGTPILFLHEFATDHRGWEPQVRDLGASYRCITYAARGYPPSDVPDNVEAYSQAIAVSDAIAALDALGIEHAHIVGVSMGAFCALHLGLGHAPRCRSIVAASCGYGAHPDSAQQFRHEAEVIASAFASEGARAVSERYATGPARVQFQNKNPRGWRQFATMLGGLSSEGLALTMRGVQARRPSLYDLRPQLAGLPMPVLLIVGDEDTGCLEANLMLKETIATAGLCVLPRTGHTVNLEAPREFNSLVRRFLADVDADAWRSRDPRSQSSSVTGMTND